MNEDYGLTDNTEKHQYEFHIEGLVHRIEYIKTNNGEIYLTHTEVPYALERRGVGSQLVKKALQDIEKQNLRLIPLCPFVAKYIQRNPEWKKMVMKEHYIEQPQV